MAHHDNTYSRFVAWLKVLLPVIALILLSSMFLISRSIDPSRAITYAKIDVEELANNQRITGPKFSGVTRDGAAISFSAETAELDADNPEIYIATELQAQIAIPDGSVVDIWSGLALVDGDQDELMLYDGVSLMTSTNYSIQTEGLRASMDTTWIESIGPITAQGPIGQFNAGHMIISQQDDDSGTYLLVFNEGVKMVYVPKNNKDE